MALNRIEAHITDSNIVNIAERAAQKGNSFDQTLDEIISKEFEAKTAPVKPAAKPAAKKTK